MHVNLNFIFFIKYIKKMQFGSSFGNGSNRANGNILYNPINKTPITCPDDYNLQKKFKYDILNSDGSVSTGQYNNVCVSKYAIKYQNININYISGMCTNNGFAVVKDDGYRCIYKSN
jgi:hypothetical protein